ncbi:MAG: hypothetical protein JXJ19_05580 [Elusimicrobia bacterium]|nr:hypothetical protein [Elusimicrobiota bacterium]
MVNINPEIDKLKERVEAFLEVNRKVELTELKVHLDCRGTDLLLALGMLSCSGRTSFHRDGHRMLIEYGQEKQ